FLAALRKTIFDDQVLTLDVAELSQPIRKVLDGPQPQVAHQPDAPHPHGLLRACRERPRRRAADSQDEIAPPHSITSSARASKVGGKVMPRVLAVLRFRTRSNLVGCCTGRSPGFSPLSTRPT